MNIAPRSRPPNPNPRSTTSAIDRSAHVLIATILFIECRRWGRSRNAILREHPRHNREHALGQAAENHGGRPPPPRRQTTDDEPRPEPVKTQPRAEELNHHHGMGLIDLGV